MTEIVEEIIKRVKDNNLPLEDGEFTIGNFTYKTIEVKNTPSWRTSYIGSNFLEYERICICMVVKANVKPTWSEETVYLAQKQTSHRYLGNVSYTYGEIIQVKPQTEEFVIDGWVKA